MGRQGGIRTPAFWVSILGGIGILAAESLAGLSFLRGAILLAFFLLAVVTASGLVLFRVPSLLLSVAVALLCVLAGAAKITFDRAKTFIPSESMMHQDQLILGQIQEPPTFIGSRAKFTLAAGTRMDGSQPYAFPAGILVTVQPTRKDSLRPKLEYGMKVALRGILAKPVGGRNPGEFNERQYYEANGVSLLMFVHGYSNVSILDTCGGWWLMREVIVPARRTILRIIDETVGAEEGEFLKGLLIGERSGISQEMREAFVNSGVAHILAVSGSNVAVVAIFLFSLLEFFRLPRTVRMIIVAAGLLFYMALTGNQPPVVRATIMAQVFLLAGLAQARSNAYNALGVSALIILGIDARQLFDVGFQLSYAAVFSIIYLYPKANTWIAAIGETTFWHRSATGLLRVCAVSLVATLGTLPMTAIYFGRVSVIGILANLVVIPATSVSVILGFVSILAGTVSHWMAETYAAANVVLLHWTLVVTTIAGNAPWASLETLRFSPGDAIPYYATIAILFHADDARITRRLMIVLLLALDFRLVLPDTGSRDRQRGTLRVSFIDVGEGDAALLECPRGTTILIDAGPRGWSYDAGKRNVGPFLRRRAIDTIDMLLISHLHDDHLGGAPWILKQFGVRRVVDNGQPVRSPLCDEYVRCRRERGCMVTTVHAGEILEVEPGIRLSILHPGAGFIERDTLQQQSKLNSGSIVLKLQYGSTSFLFAGDADLEAEAELLRVYGSFLRSNVLKAGHHGSITSNSQEFLDAVRPDHAVISVGRNNKFQHPSQTVVERFELMHVHVIRTDDDGAAIFESDGETVSRVFWRQDVNF